MNIVVLKSEEDLLLSDCDNSCSNGNKCVCKKILKTDNAGQGMYDYGFSKCVACIRRDYSKAPVETDPPYRVVLDGYPESWVTSKGVAFIRFLASDYTVVGGRKIIQNIDGPLVPISWVTKMYETSTIMVPKSSTKWFLSVCETSGCKQNIHSYIDEHRAIGIDTSYMDLTDGAVKCKFCDNNLKYVNEQNGIVEYRHTFYSQCRFCDTVVKHKPSAAIQICTTCRANQDEDLKMLERVCMYCGNTIPVTKKGGSQSIIVKMPDGTVKDMFLCRHHKIRTLNGQDVYDYGHILKMI